MTYGKSDLPTDMHLRACGARSFWATTLFVTLQKTLKVCVYPWCMLVRGLPALPQITGTCDLRFLQLVLFDPANKRSWTLFRRASTCIHRIITSPTLRLHIPSQCRSQDHDTHEDTYVYSGTYHEGHTESWSTSPAAGRNPSAGTHQPG